jgi:uncharacterized protein YsxB (DUF464 family)
MVKASFYNVKNKHFALRILGHAEFNPGNDIVCAAVSALAYTFAGAVQGYGDIGKLRLESGDFVCTLDTNGREKADSDHASIVFDTILLGLKQIEATYPDNIRVELIENL